MTAAGGGRRWALAAAGAQFRPVQLAVRLLTVAVLLVVTEARTSMALPSTADGLGC